MLAAEGEGDAEAEAEAEGSNGRSQQIDYHTRFRVAWAGLLELGWLVYADADRQVWSVCLCVCV
jgi:hypothetical protein